MLLPALTGSGVSVLEIWRSADVETVVVSVSPSSPGLPSVVVDVTLAVFERTVPSAVAGSTATTSVKTALPTPKLGFVQLIAPAAPTAGVVHDHPATLDSDTNVVPVMVSLHDALAAASGPLFVTVMVYVRLLPALTGS